MCLTIHPSFAASPAVTERLTFGLRIRSRHRGRISHTHVGDLVARALCEPTVGTIAPLSHALDDARLSDRPPILHLALPSVTERNLLGLLRIYTHTGQQHKKCEARIAQQKVSDCDVSSRR